LQNTAPELTPAKYSKQEWKHAGMSTFEERSRKINANTKTQTMMEIDDDGPRRQKRRLQPQGSDANRQITKSLFDFVRRGQVKEAIKMCELCDEPWQSAGLYGYLEHNQGMTGRPISFAKQWNFHSYLYVVLTQMEMAFYELELCQLQK
jgi:hypothetical protein